MDEELIAPCGINCGVCRMYLSRDRGLYKSENAGCTGCVPRNTGCKMKGGCQPLNSHEVRFCFECKDFPCPILNSLEKRYASKYKTSVIENLKYIQERGLPDFLTEEKSKWACKECGGTVSMHTWACIDCGKEIPG